jgi:hypothetical protein
LGVIEPDQDRRVDELRQQLRQLGYLDAGVNRFVLGPATAARDPLVIALLASVRVGCLAALLLGPAAAIGLNGRLPGLVTGPRDAIVVAGYLGVLFGAGVSLVALLTSLLVSSLAAERVARRARPLSRAAGGAVAVACLAYLTLWGRSANAGFGWTAPLWTGFALGVAVTISLLLGHVVTAAAFAVIIARRGSGLVADAPGGSRLTPSSSTWKMTIVAALVAFAGAAALLVVTAPSERSSGQRIPLAVVPSGLRVRLVAIDGVDPGVLDELAAAGRIPWLTAALTGTRARLALQDANAPRDPARSWTTIATGHTPEVHGVRGLETRRIAGLQGTVSAGERSPLGRAIRTATDLLRLTRPALASGNERRVKTMWDVASDAGLRTAIVNWWATWPAASAGSLTVLSDRATLRLEHGGPLDAEIAPASLYEALRARWPAIRHDASAQARAAAVSLAWDDPDIRAALERSAELDAIQLALAHEVSNPPPDLSAVYLPGLDIAQNTLLGGRDTALAPSVVAGRLQALRDYYVFLDRLLTHVLSPADEELVVVVTEPGRVTAASDGLMGMTGRVAATNKEVTGRVTDVAPTVLHALGVPVSRELAGAPLIALFTDTFAQRYPVREIETYGPPMASASERGGKPLDQEMIDRLRSLGYVK